MIAVDPAADDRFHDGLDLLPPFGVWDAEHGDVGHPGTLAEHLR